MIPARLYGTSPTEVCGHEGKICTMKPPIPEVVKLIFCVAPPQLLTTYLPQMTPDKTFRLPHLFANKDPATRLVRLAPAGRGLRRAIRLLADDCRRSMAIDRCRKRKKDSRCQWQPWNVEKETTNGDIKLCDGME